MQRKKLTIGLFGFGCVGYGLYEALRKTPTLNAEIKAICVKNRNKERPIDPAHFTFNKQVLLDDPDINVVVELIDDADAAFEIVSAALRKGKAVVTANKKMVAEHFSELLGLQKKHNVPLLYEAACCASIPVIRNLEEYYDNDLLLSLEGIVNGSTNYILTKTTNEGLSYSEALRKAQELGFAESDPSLDTGGHDAAYKLQLLVAHAFGVVARPADIFRAGIDRLDAAALRYAREKGTKIKLVARARRAPGGRVSAYVLPSFVLPGDRLYQVDDVYNGVKIESCFSDVQFFAGKGAGAFPTASAVISDISALSYDYRYGYRKLAQGGALAIDDEIQLEVLVTHTETDTATVQEKFFEIKEAYRGGGKGYTTGALSLALLKELLALRPQLCVVLIREVEAVSYEGAIISAPAELLEVD